MKTNSLIIFFLINSLFSDSFAQTKESENKFNTGLGVQFSGKGDLEGSNYFIGYKRILKKNFFIASNYQKLNYKVFLESSTRLRSTNSFQLLIGKSLGKKNKLNFGIGPIYSLNSNRIINGPNTFAFIGIDKNTSILIPADTSYGYKQNAFGYTLQLAYLFKITKKARFGPMFQFENDEIGSSVSVLRLGFEVAL
jgi:hypothetical protein